MGTKSKIFHLFFFIFCFFVTFCGVSQALDRSRYIGIDEIRPGMKAYCLTCYKGTKIEKFDMVVLDVVRNINPGGSAGPGSRDAILVQGTDERFIHTGPVAGCSGSPVYIDGRLAGALAFAWSFSKDPLYGVTPIEEMLEVGTATNPQSSQGQMAFGFDYSVPIDFAQIYSQITSGQNFTGNNFSSTNALRSPLITSGLPGEVCDQLETMVKPLGFMVVSGAGSGQAVNTDQGQGPDRLEPGSSLAVPLVTGDITVVAMGTVTEVDGNDVYGFGHSFLGHGDIDLPMATGWIHTVVSSVVSSFKFGSMLNIVGALRADEAAAIRGKLGAKAKMIPLTIKVERFNDSQVRQYNCQIANNRLYTPAMVGTVVQGATLQLGDLPLDHMIEYRGKIEVAGFEPIVFENISTGIRLREMLSESVGAVAMLMNNPYRQVDIKSLDFEVRTKAKSVVSHIWSADISDSIVKAGEKIDVSVIIESIMVEKKKYEFSLKVPEDVKPGKYDLILTGGYGYQKFLRKTEPYKFVSGNLPDLVEAIDYVLNIDRDRLYCILVLSASGVTVEKAELPDLPPTRALVLADRKRTLKFKPYQHRLEKSLKTDTVIADKKVIEITVEK